MSDLGGLIESLEAERDTLRREVQRLCAAAAQAPERVKRAFVEGADTCTKHGYTALTFDSKQMEAEAARRLAEGTL